MQAWQIEECAALETLFSPPIDALLRPSRELLQREMADLLNDLKNVPKNAAVRKVNELVKRVRLSKAHAHIIGTIDPNGDKSHEWWPLFLEYQQSFVVGVDHFSRPKQAFRIICNLIRVNSVFQEMYQRLILPLYIIIAGFVASCLVIKSRNQFLSLIHI